MPRNTFFDYPEEAGFSVEEFVEIYPDIPTDSITDNTISEAIQQVWEFVNAHSGTYWKAIIEIISDYQMDSLKKAAVIQLRYNINNGGSLQDASGINEGTGGFVDYKQLQARIVAPTAINILERSGLLSVRLR